MWFGKSLFHIHVDVFLDDYNYIIIIKMHILKKNVYLIQINQ